MKQAIFPIACATLLLSWILLVQREDPPEPMTYAEAVASVDERGAMLPPEIAPGIIERDEYHLVGLPEELPDEVEWIAAYDHLELEELEAEFAKAERAWQAVYLPALMERTSAGAIVDSKPEHVPDDVMYAPYHAGDYRGYVMVREVDVKPDGFRRRRCAEWLNHRIMHKRADDGE